MNTLKKALLVNATSSFLSGLTMVLFPVSLMHLFQINSPTIFWVIGIALIFFSGTILWERDRQRRLAVLWIIIQDAIWVVSSAVLLIWRPFALSDAGYLLIAVFAVLVTGFIVFQSIGMAHKNKGCLR